MAVKIKVSYTTAQELQEVLKLLQPAIKTCKPDKGKQGQYKKAYIELNI